MPINRLFLHFDYDVLALDNHTTQSAPYLSLPSAWSSWGGSSHTSWASAFNRYTNTLSWKTHTHMPIWTTWHCVWVISEHVGLLRDVEMWFQWPTHATPNYESEIMLRLSVQTTPETKTKLEESWWSFKLTWNLLKQKGTVQGRALIGHEILIQTQIQSPTRSKPHYCAFAFNPTWAWQRQSNILRFWVYNSSLKQDGAS